MCPINRWDSILKPHFTELNFLTAGVAKIYVLVSGTRKKTKIRNSSPELQIGSRMKYRFSEM